MNMTTPVNLDDLHVLLKQVLLVLREYLVQHDLYAQPPTRSSESRDIYDVPVKYLDLPVRVRNTLLSEEINTIRELKGKTDIDLLEIPGFGMGSLKTVKRALANFEVLYNHSDNTHEVQP